MDSPAVRLMSSMDRRFHRILIMHSRRTLHAILLTVGAAATLHPAAATAQTGSKRFEVIRPSPGENKADDGPPLLEVKFDTSYTAGGETEFRSAQFGDSSALNFSLSASTFLPLGASNEKWMMPFDLQSQNVSLDSLAGTPVPDTIHTLEISTGLAYKLDEHWMFMARISPSLYKFEDIGGNDIGVSGGLMVEWERSPSVKWMFGLIVSPDNEIPVLPVVGVDWRINEQWELQLMMLSPRVIYTLADSWRLHAGMGLNFGSTFRAEDALGTSIGLPKFDDALGSYSDLRFGCGVEYELNRSWSFEVEAGYSINREIDYQDIDETVKFDDAPYFRMGMKFEF